jgi:hypothetical protein
MEAKDYGLGVDILFNVYLFWSGFIDALTWMLVLMTTTFLL